MKNESRISDVLRMLVEARQKGAKDYYEIWVDSPVSCENKRKQICINDFNYKMVASARTGKPSIPAIILDGKHERLFYNKDWALMMYLLCDCLETRGNIFVGFIDGDGNEAGVTGCSIDNLKERIYLECDNEGLRFHDWFDED